MSKRRARGAGLLKDGYQFVSHISPRVSLSSCGAWYHGYRGKSELLVKGTLNKEPRRLVFVAVAQ
jgi:hypothetical protein